MSCECEFREEEEASNNNSSDKGESSEKILDKSGYFEGRIEIAESNRVDGEAGLSMVREKQRCTLIRQATVIYAGILEGEWSTNEFVYESDESMEVVLDLNFQPIFPLFLN